MAPSTPSVDCGALFSDWLNGKIECYASVFRSHTRKSAQSCNLTMTDLGQALRNVSVIEIVTRTCKWNPWPLPWSRKVVIWYTVIANDGDVWRPTRSTSVNLHTLEQLKDLAAILSTRCFRLFAHDPLSRRFKRNLLPVFKFMWHCEMLCNHCETTCNNSFSIKTEW